MAVGKYGSEVGGCFDREHRMTIKTINDLENEPFARMDNAYDHVNAMLYRLMKNWKREINQ
jgi:hypothetical protein